MALAVSLAYPWHPASMLVFPGSAPALALGQVRAQVTLLHLSSSHHLPPEFSQGTFPGGHLLLLV